MTAARCEQCETTQAALDVCRQLAGPDDNPLVMIAAAASEAARLEAVEADHEKTREALAAALRVADELELARRLNHERGEALRALTARAETAEKALELATALKGPPRCCHANCVGVADTCHRHENAERERAERAEADNAALRRELGLPGPTNHDETPLRERLAMVESKLRSVESDNVALRAACADAVEELRTDENYVGDNGGAAEFLVNLRAALASPNPGAHLIAERREMRDFIRRILPHFARADWLGSFGNEARALLATTGRSAK